MFLVKVNKYRQSFVINCQSKLLLLLFINFTMPEVKHQVLHLLSKYSITEMHSL